MSRLLIFSEQPEWFTHSRSFVMSDLSDLLTSLFENKGMSESLVFKKTYKKWKKNIEIRFYYNIFEQIASFLWEKEPPEQSAHGRS